MFPSIKTALIAFALGALLCLPTGYYVHRYDTNAEAVAIDNLKQQAQDTLLEQTRLTSAKESQLASLGQQIEATRNAAQKVLDDNATLNARLVAARGLFDPGRRSGGSGAVCQAASVAAPGVPASAPDDGRLSSEASDFLLGLTDRANRSRQYASDCREWVVDFVAKMNQAASSPESTGP